MTYPRSNEDIALQLLSQFKSLIDNLSHRMGATYHLSKQDREDLVSAATARIGSVRWRTVLRRRPSVEYNLNKYVITTIRIAMAKEVRRIKAFGLSGLSKGPALADFPYEPYSIDITYKDNNDLHGSSRGMTPSSLNLLPKKDREKLSADGLPDRLAARQLVALATQVLDASEQTVIAMLFAFDGGPSRTEQEVARELDISRAKVANLVESAMVKLRRAAGAAIYSPIEDFSPCPPTSPSQPSVKVPSPASKTKS